MTYVKLVLAGMLCASFVAAQGGGSLKFDDGIVALLRKVNAKWTVVQYVIGATDVPYVDWDEKYRAPKGIFIP